MLSGVARQSKPQSRGYSAERVVNVFARNSDGISQLPLMGRGGFTTLAEVGGPVRAMCGMGGYVYAAAGGGLWRWRTGAVDFVGSIPDDANTTMVASGTQLAIVAGNSYFVASGLVVNSYTTGAIDTPVGVAYQDGYFIVIGNSAGRQDGIAVSRLDQATVFNSLDFAFAESLADDLKAVISDHGELWFFGQDSVEVWYNSGNEFPFSPNTAARIEHGCSVGKTVAKADNAVFWYGDNGAVYRSGGGTPAVISTREVEEELAKSNVLGGFTFTDRGHVFYAILREDGTTLCFDATTNLWAERSTGVHDAPWICTCAARVNGREYFGTSTNKIGVLEVDQYTDDGLTVEAEVITVPIEQGGKNFRINKVHASIATGRADLGQVVDGHEDWIVDDTILVDETGDEIVFPALTARKPKVMLQVSKDGHTWGNERWRELGALGEYATRAAWHGIGTGRRFQFRLRITDPIPKDIYGGAYE